MANADLAQLERGRLCDLFLEVGPDSPTLCEGWTTADLAAHLVIRERKPLAAPGIVAGGRLGEYSEKVRLATRDGASFTDLVEPGCAAGRPPCCGRWTEPSTCRSTSSTSRTCAGCDGTGEPRPAEDEVADVEAALWAMQGRRTKFLTRTLDDIDLTLALPDGETKPIGGGSAPGHRDRPRRRAHAVPGRTTRGGPGRAEG